MRHTSPPFAARAALLLACGLAALPAAALNISFFSGATQTITDNGVGDLNPTVGILDFSTTVGAYNLVGRLDNGAGANLVQLLGPMASVRLTNFTATAVGLPPSAIGIVFSDSVAGTYATLNAADAIDPYGANAVGAPVPPGTDLIQDWVGFVGGQTIPGLMPGPPPYLNGLVPPSSPPVPYMTPVIWHGASLLTGPFVTPVFGGRLTFRLGAPDDQLVLLSSANVGIAPVPELPPAALLAAGLAALALRRRR